MLIHYSYLLISVIVIYVGAEWLVKGSTGLARHFGLSPLITGLTIVAYGTSAPELVIALEAALLGKSDLAVGNVLGSNLGNFGIVLGLTALISPIKVNWSALRPQFLMVATLTAAIPALTGWGLNRAAGALLLSLAAAYCFWFFRHTKQSTSAQIHQIELDAETAGAPSVERPAFLGLTLVIAFALLAIGADLFLDSAVRIAQSFGLRDVTTGMAVLSLATTLPELMTSLLAARRGRTDVALGNILGSNIFNTSVILGSLGVFAPPQAAFVDIWFQWTSLAILTLLAAYFVITQKKVSRIEGTVLAVYHLVILGIALYRDWQ